MITKEGVVSLDSNGNISIPHQKSTLVGEDSVGLGAICDNQTLEGIVLQYWKKSTIFNLPIARPPNNARSNKSDIKTSKNQWVDKAVLLLLHRIVRT